MSGMQVEGLDHVHVLVGDREAAARWFARVLGLRPAAAFADWARESGGPLFRETEGGETGGGRPCLALFAGAPVTEGDHTIAFRTDAAGFLAFLRRLRAEVLLDRDGSRVTAADVVDHDRAWSIYFCDPDGNRFELTTYDHAAVSGRLHEVAGAGR